MKRVTAKYGWPCKRGDHISRFYCTRLLPLHSLGTWHWMFKHSDFILQVLPPVMGVILTEVSQFCEYFPKNKEKHLKNFPIIKGQVASQNLR